MTKDVEQQPVVLYEIGGVEIDPTTYALPSGKTFRDAWADAGENVIEVDMVVARKIWRDKLRLSRSSEFLDLDAQFLKALETGKDTSEIVARKQELRDAPSSPAIEAAQTPEELMSIAPEGLVVE